MKNSMKRSAFTIVAALCLLLGARARSENLNSILDQISSDLETKKASGSTNSTGTPATKKSTRDEVPKPLPAKPRNLPVSSSATPAPQPHSSSGPRYTGVGRVYKVPELKDLVGHKLNNAWLYGDFLLKDVKGNIGLFVTTAIVLLPKEGSTQVRIEFPNGITLSQAAVNTLRDPMLVLPVSFAARDPMLLLSVTRMSDGRLLVTGRARGALRFYLRHNICQRSNNQK